VFFSIGRDKAIDSCRFLRVELGSTFDDEITLDKISTTLRLCHPELANEDGLFEDLRLLRNDYLLYFPQCRYLEDEQVKQKFLNVLKQIVETTRKIKVIVEV